MTAQNTDQQTQEKTGHHQPTRSTYVTASAYGILMAAALIAAALNSFSHGETALGWTMVATSVLACAAPPAIAIRFRRKRGP